MFINKVEDVLSLDISEQLFPPERQLIPNLDDVYELELAFYENKLLTDEEILRYSAYFSRVGETCTRHFLMCTGDSLRLPKHSSSRLKSFFEKNQFRTGYATHGLFPYRGKFHPQMIKALLNIMGLKPGNTVLDPMMGSGTVCVEACLMGINSIGVDVSPFCRFMASTKIDTLTMNLDRAGKALSNYEEVFTYFQKKAGKPNSGSKARNTKKNSWEMSVMEPEAQYELSGDQVQLSENERETRETYNFLLLAYLDSAGYSERSGRRTPLEHFKAVLEKYLFVAEKIQDVLKGVESDLGHSKVMVGDARALELDKESVDGVIFSPPYSFAIDYLKNDAFHLNFLGADTEKLRENMIGLRGKKLFEKFDYYQSDMDRILAECARVLRAGHICTIIVGTNNNQLGKVLGVRPEEVRGLHEILIDLAEKHNFRLVKMMSRPITGISNTMRREYIVMLRRD